MLTRRSLLIALPAALGTVGQWRTMRASVPAGVRRVAVVYPSALEPCKEAVEGLRLRLSGNDVVLALLDLSDSAFAADTDREMGRKPAAIVAVGSDAVHAVLARETPCRIVSTMTLEADGAGPAAQAGRVTAAVHLDIPIHTLIAELRKVFPERTRVGLIRNPGRGGYPAPQSHTQPLDPGLQIADCTTADELLPVFLAFRKKVDFVVCLPDGALYN